MDPWGGGVQRCGAPPVLCAVIPPRGHSGFMGLAVSRPMAISHDLPSERCLTRPPDCSGPLVLCIACGREGGTVAGTDGRGMRRCTVAVRSTRKAPPRGLLDQGALDMPRAPYKPPCDIPSGCCSFTGPWTVTRSSLRMLCRVAAFCRPLRLVSFPRSRSPAPPPASLLGVFAQRMKFCAEPRGRS